MGVADAIGQVTTLAYEVAADPLKITKITDPFGRTATFTYDSVGRLASITDPYTYNAAGQVLTLTNAKNETTTYAYDPVNGRLTSITGPVAGATTSFTYDALSRVRTVFAWPIVSALLGFQSKRTRRSGRQKNEVSPSRGATAARG